MTVNRRAGHKFNIDQTLDYVPRGASKLSVPREACKITKLLPERDGELQYRIKNAGEGMSGSQAKANSSVFSMLKWSGPRGIWSDV